MKKDDLADFLAGERASVESALGNLRLIFGRTQNQAVHQALYHWITTLESINRNMSKICNQLRQNQI